MGQKADKKDQQKNAQAQIFWVCCRSYQEMTEQYNVLYLHESERGEPLFWGRAIPALLAGASRDIDGVQYSPHIRPVAQSFIEECMRLGQSVYAGKIVERSSDTSPLNILHQLIYDHQTRHQHRKRKPKAVEIEHTGTPPACIRLRWEQEAADGGKRKSV